MQIHTECVEMADFLFKRHVSDVHTPLYSCGKALETPEHVLLHCNEIAKKKGNSGAMGRPYSAAHTPEFSLIIIQISEVYNRMASAGRQIRLI
jgi:hypothetical protein